MATAFSKLNVTIAQLLGGTNPDLPASFDNPIPMISGGTSNLATGQVTITTAATQIVAARAGRSSVMVQNLGTTDVWIGPANTVTVGNGILLVGTKGATLTIPTQGALWGIVQTGTQAVAFSEGY